jgi:hypothetical protein
MTILSMSPVTMVQAEGRRSVLVMASPSHQTQARPIVSDISGYQSIASTQALALAIGAALLTTCLMQLVL